jgi:acyl-coenzyme A thioesterase THEM4
MSSSPPPPPSEPFLDFGPPPPEVQTLLQRIPWCAKLLDEPSNSRIRPFHSPNRTPKPPTTEDSLMSQTLATASTIETWQGFYVAPSSASSTSSPSNTTSTGTFLFLISLGSGLNGHPDTLHGGVASLVLDELLGQVAYAHRDHPDAHLFTATMTVDFERPLRTPALVLGRGWLDAPRCVGRKVWVEGVLEDGSTGVVFARARSLFVRVRDGHGDGKL